MTSSLEELLAPPAPESVLELRTSPHWERFSFDDAVYDPRTDRLRLTVGPPAAACAQFTPEGHLVRVDALDGGISGVVLVGVHDHLERDGRVQITLGPEQVATLGPTEIAALLSRAVVRCCDGRFA